jgi:hypothetical protein
MVTSQKPTAPVVSPNAKPTQPAASSTPPVTPAHPTPSSQQLSAIAPQPSEGEIRDYANHLYTQRGSVNGHDGDDWLEAEVCLRANIPKESSRTRMHHHTQITDRTVLALVKHGRS